MKRSRKGKAFSTAKLPALEKNVLKYRALQIILLLHEVESFRAFLIGSIRATDQFSEPEQHRLPPGAKRPMERALAILVSDGILTTDESAELQRIIDLRNTIGHAIHELVEDVSAPLSGVVTDSAFDYAALRRLQRLRRKVDEGMRDGYILEMGLREARFEQAAATYQEELTRLRKRIHRQVNKRSEASLRVSR